MYDSNFDSQRLMFHPGEVAHWLEHGKTKGPLYTEMGLSSRCTCRCIFCGVDHLVNESHVDIDTKDATRAIEELQSIGNRSIMFAGHGESLLHPDAADIITFASRKMSASVTTNGCQLDNASLPLIDGLKWIRFSINGCDATNYAAVHNVPKKVFTEVMANLEKTVARKRSLKLDTVIGVQLVLLDENAAGLVPFAKELRSIGVDYFSVKPYSQHPLSKCRFEPDYEGYADLETEINALQTDSFRAIYRARAMDRLQHAKRYSECHGTHFLCFISPDCNVWECNVFAGDPRFLIGNARDESLAAIWNGARRQEVLDFIATELDIETECRNLCRMDGCNCFLSRLENPLAHDDFI